MNSINYSIIIPHHNSPDLLSRLLASIPQRKDIEIIVIDDNSDSDKQATKIRQDMRVIYIDKENTKGPGKARNVGISEANGKWLLFADSDDFYNPDFLLILDAHINEDIDVLYYEMDCVDSQSLKKGKHDRVKLMNASVESYDETKEKEDELRYKHYVPWRFMLRNAFVKHYCLKYDEICIGEDTLFSICVGYFANKISVDRRKVYTVTYSESSIMFSKYSKEKRITAFKYREWRKAFNIFVGHSLWNAFSIRNSPTNNYVYLLSIIRRDIFEGLFAFVYYMKNIKYIKENSSYYVDIIKQLQIREKSIC